jgi:hypothetical protein
VSSAINSFVNIAVLNIASKLETEQEMLKTKQKEQIERERDLLHQQNEEKETDFENFIVATNLHKLLAVSFATCGSDAFDCLFLLSPATDDSTALLEAFRILSNNSMFSQNLSSIEVKTALSGKNLPLTPWLADILDSSAYGSPVPYYMLLLSRIELAMWSAYYTINDSKSSISSLGSVSFRLKSRDESISTVGNRDDLLDSSMGTREGTMGETKGETKGGEGNFKRRITAPKVPVRSTLRVLERSNLSPLSSSAVMLSLG